MRKQTLCVRFAYSMHGFHVGELRLIARGPGDQQSIYWYRDGPQGGELQWFTASESVHIEDKQTVSADLRSTNGAKFAICKN